VLAVAAIVTAAVVGGESSQKPVDRAVGLVPPGASLYVHADVAEDSDQLRRFLDVTGRLPSLARLERDALRRLAAGGDPVALQIRVRPWLGDEAALALLPDGNRATSLILLEVASRPRAQQFLASLGRATTTTYRGIEVRSYGTRAAAFIGRFLAIGNDFNVRAAVDALRGGSLEDRSDFQAAVQRLDLDDRFAYAYVSNQGLGLVKGQGGAAARLATLFQDPALRGAAAAVRFEGEGARLSVSRALLPSAQQAEAAQASFTPGIPGEIPSDTLAYLGEKGVDRIAETLSRFGGGSGSSSPLSLVLDRLGINLGRPGERLLLRAVQSLFGREAGLVVLPPDELPSINLLVLDTSQEEGGDVLVKLQPLFSKLLQASASGGQVPVLQPERIGDLEALTLRINAAVQLTYAAFGGRVAISSDPDGIRRLSSPGSSLEDNPAFAPGMRNLLEGASSVLFLDLRRLSSQVQQTGFGATPELRPFAVDLARIGRVTAITKSERSSQAVDIFVEVP
jgi:hypothetical protein